MRLARFHGDGAMSEFAQHTVGHGMERVFARTDVRNGELALLVAASPEFIVLGIGLPVDLPRRCDPTGPNPWRGVGRMREAHEQIGRLRAGHLRIAELQPASYRGTLTRTWIINASNPVIRPLRGLLGRL